MKLHEHSRASLNLVGGYGAGFVQVGPQRYTAPLVVAPDRIHPEWIPGLAALDEAALELLWPLSPRIVLLGGAAPGTAVLPAVRRLCLARGAALEWMDLGAACRTYNVLAQEDRAVVALLFP
jgi:uncharacterized protein